MAGRGLPPADSTLQLRERKLEDHWAAVRAARLEIDPVQAVEKRSSLLGSHLLVSPDGRVAGHGCRKIVERVVKRACPIEMLELSGEIAQKRAEIDSP